MRQTWQDPRLAFGELRLAGNDKPITSLTVRLLHIFREVRADENSIRLCHTFVLSSTIRSQFARQFPPKISVLEASFEEGR